jgi:hypothetical protein
MQLQHNETHHYHSPSQSDMLCPCYMVFHDLCWGTPVLNLRGKLKPTICICVSTNSFISNSELLLTGIFQYGCESFSFVSLFESFSCKEEMNMRDHMPAAGDMFFKQASELAILWPKFFQQVLDLKLQDYE